MSNTSERPPSKKTKTMLEKVKFYSQYMLLVVAVAALIMFICYLSNGFSANPEDYRISSRVCLLISLFQISCLFGLFHNKGIPEKQNWVNTLKIFIKINIVIAITILAMGAIFLLSNFLAGGIVYIGVRWNILNPAYTAEIAMVMVIIVFISIVCLTGHILDKLNF